VFFSGVLARYGHLETFQRAAGYNPRAQFSSGDDAVKFLEMCGEFVELFVVEVARDKVMTQGAHERGGLHPVFFDGHY